MPLKSGVTAPELSTLGERELRERVLSRPLPRHVAIIMDGNGRWATSRGLPRVAGHGEGVKSVRSVRFRVIGRPNGVPAEVQRRIDHVVEATAANTGLNLLMAFNYGARDEIVDACRRLARDVAEGRLGPEQIDEVRLGRALYTDGVPDPDLLIRTSGEMRLSNFLLWQIAYTELWVTPTRWPDFEPRDLYLAVADFQQRDRRFGRV